MTPPVAWAKRDQPAPIWNSSGIPVTTPITNVSPKMRPQKRAESAAATFPRKPFTFRITMRRPSPIVSCGNR